MKGPSKRLVAIAVPLSDRKEFTAEEEISLRHLMHFLGKYDKYFVLPENLEISRHGFGVKRFEKKYFGSLAAHTKLMLSSRFYESFTDYEYILVYHLDSLVFSDQLKQWCEQEFDYIGSPWIRCEEAPYAGTDIENKVGNGGFSLRKVESFLKVLQSSRYSVEPAVYWKRNYSSKKIATRLLNIHKRLLKHLTVFNGVSWEISHYRNNEDPFWAKRAKHYYPDFLIAPLDIALCFAFEYAPRICFEKNNHALPFGCHAWHKYDRAFWEPFLIK